MIAHLFRFQQHSRPWHLPVVAGICVGVTVLVGWYLGDISAGVTIYCPLKHWNAVPGKKVGIIGIGGLGHMIRVDQINEAFQRLEKNDLRYRFVIDFTASGN